jgi:hypothetical protein
MRVFAVKVQPTLVGPGSGISQRPMASAAGQRGAGHHPHGRERCSLLRTGPSRRPLARGRATARANRIGPQAKRRRGSAAGDPERGHLGARSRAEPSRRQGAVRRPCVGRPQPSPGLGCVAPAKTLALRIPRCPRMRRSHSWRIASAALLAVTFFPLPFAPRPEQGTGRSRSVNDRKFSWPSLQQPRVDALRQGARAAPGMTAGVAPHFCCLLRQSRNSWNSSWLAAAGLPATPSCCFMKSWNFARSSGSCAFLSSHS